MGSTAIELSSVAIEPAVPDARRVVQAFLRARNPNTLRAYRKDLDDFAEFLKVRTPEAATDRLLQSRVGRANELALEYRDALVLRGLTPATVNRRLSALRSLIRLARRIGVVDWEIDVDGIDGRAYRDTRGPGSEKVGAMLEELGDDAKGKRDEAIVRLLHDRGLRRGEVVSLDVEHFDPARGVQILGKGRKEREWLSLPPETTEAIQAWLDIREEGGGPLFTSLDHANFGHRLTGAAIWQIIRKLGARVGVVTRPHGLRHSAITTSLQKNNGNVVESKAFSRHADANTLLRYNDNREDKGGRLAALVAVPKRVKSFDDKAWEAFARYVTGRWPGRKPEQGAPSVVAGWVRTLQKGTREDRARAARAVCSKMPWWDGKVPAVVGGSVFG